MDAEQDRGSRPGTGWLLAGAAALAVLLTYLYLVRFAYPVNDDWSFAAAGRDAGVWAANRGYWNDFGGRWSAGFLLYGMGVFTDLPAVYPLLIAVIFAALAAAGWPLLHALGVRGPRRLWIGTMVLAAVQFTALPVVDVGNLGKHLAMAETVYWVSGVVNYASAYAVLACAAWGMTAVRNPWVGGGIAVAAGVVVAGLSEMAGIGAIALGALLGALGCRRGWLLAAGGVAGLGIVACAPGNLKRLGILQHDVQEGAGVGQLPRAMLYAAWLVGDHLATWLLNPAMAALAGCAAWLGGQQPGPVAPHPRRRVVLVVLATVLGAWAMAVPTFALVGFLEARHEGLVSLAAVAGLLAAAWLAGRAWPVWVRSTWAARLWLVWVAACLLLRCLRPSPIEPAGLDMVAMLGLLAGGVCVVYGLRGARVGGAVLALALLLQPAWWQAIADACGKAPVLHARQMARDDEVRRLKAAGFDAVVLPWLGDRAQLPRTIRLYEVQPGWMVDAYAGYFGLRTVKLSQRVQSPMGLVDKPQPAAAPTP